MDITFDVTDLLKMQERFKKAPNIALKWLSKAVEATAFEGLKLTMDTPSNSSNIFQFVTPRQMRTGQLARSHATSLKIKGLEASFGARVSYAEKFIARNDYRTRVKDELEPLFKKHTQDAIQNIIKEI